MQHRPRKRFGQNFLQSPHVIMAIIQAINPKPDDIVVEIGPGQGALTRPLLQRLNALTAIEIDRDLQPFLKALPDASNKLTVLDRDALSVDFSELGNDLRIVGNLPYNISTPLILHLVQDTSSIKDMHFMLQKEVVERLAASPGGKDYGRLSVMVQYFCEVEPLFVVPPEVFFPKPKVDSAVVRLTPHTHTPYPEIDFKNLESLVAKAFSMRRKTLANNLKPIVDKASLITLGIDPTRRPEQISISEYVQIAKFVAK
ncbi:16S rRNA (adenine(1518)-N(6)/adenine(1519)-N(6))-dimethyltransferase RsmA [Legionella impletisoli]|uniref:Ribosomal RNA small subunit methyltransferase A n=1 Tax=Legionella impletisoli TaxID=343510 RepID=A0A917NCS1_9GAMM|nr:16S rRNA (adenine(1518)-N(6)/adenine(1519)-N(6))-dimethyltransferase RsmA [Legionella impletisoli]GGI84963.1 ribosomal RNA small subunit methyltransferase A [Legionella impletisoli]